MNEQIYYFYYYLIWLFATKSICCSRLVFLFFFGIIIACVCVCTFISICILCVYLLYICITNKSIPYHVYVYPTLYVILIIMLTDWFDWSIYNSFRVFLQSHYINYHDNITDMCTCPVIWIHFHASNEMISVLSFNIYISLTLVVSGVMIIIIAWPSFIV